MKNDRLKLAVDPDYTAALGLAVFAFASLEWNAVQCCERLEFGSIDALIDRTAGRVADTLNRHSRSAPIESGRRELEQAASDFRAYVGTRNNLLHAKPGASSDGSPRLFRNGDQWTIEEINAVADAFADCSGRFAVWLAVSAPAQTHEKAKPHRRKIEINSP